MPRKCIAWEQRFWPKVHKQSDGCWIWIGARKETGHGQFQMRHKTKSAYKFLWEQLYGPVPNGLCLLHKCNQAACVNPDHLMIGTQAQNIRHMIQSGRYRGGRYHVPIGTLATRFRPPRKTMEQRFWAKVEKTEACWIWIGSLMNGYGGFNIGVKRGGKIKRAHRVSWELHYGPIQDELDVLHTCDNRCCVRPDHLYLGTDADNVRDTEKRNRGRHPSGENHGRNKLSSQKILEIRKLCDGKISTYAELGKRFGVTRQNIRAIHTRRSWKHLI